MQAIVTKYFPATNHTGPRIKATAESGSVTIPFSYKGSTSDAHRAAALALIKKLGWEDCGPIIGGGLPSNADYVFVFNNSAAY